MAHPEQLFDFEEWVIQASSGPFVPLRDSDVSSHNGNAQFAPFIGAFFDVLYALNDGRIVFVQYEGGKRSEVEVGEGIQNIWRDGKLTRVWEVDAEYAANRLVEWHKCIPSEWQEPLATKRKSEWARENAEPRPLCNWVGKGYLSRTDPGSRPFAHEADPIALSRRVLKVLLPYIQCVGQLKAGQRRTSKLDSLTLADTLFSQYRVDPEVWWRHHEGLPPMHISLIGFDWPEGSNPIREIICQLAIVLEPPLSLLACRIKPGDSDFPRRIERDHAEKTLVNELPRLEQWTLELKATLSNFSEQETCPPAVQLKKRKLPPRPNEVDVQIHRLASRFSGTQATIAEIYERLFHLPCDQSRVSRALSRVDTWIKAGQIVPAANLPTPDQAKAMDPKLLDLGPHRESRPKRQRGKSDEERA